MLSDESVLEQNQKSMKIYSYKSNPIKKGITSIGAYLRPSFLKKQSLKISRLNINCSTVTHYKLCTSYKLWGVIFATLIIFAADSFALTPVFNFEEKRASLNKDTEAIPEIQAPGLLALSDKSQLLDIIGLFALSETAKEFLAVSSNGKVSVWQLKTGKENILFPIGEPISACSYNPSRKLLAVSQDTGVFCMI